MTLLGILAVALTTTLGCAGIEGLWRAAILEPMAEAHRALQQHSGSTLDADDHGLPVRPAPHAITEAGAAYLREHVTPGAFGAGVLLGICGAWALLRLTRRDPSLMAERGLVRTFQNLRLFAGLTVREHVEVAAHAAGEDEAHALRLLAKVGLAGLEDQPASALAYGQMRRLELARALARQPKLLLLDEPAAGLGTQETKLLREVLRELRQSGISILLIEHDMELVMEMCDRVVVLDHGQKIAEGTPAQVRAHPEVIAAYLGTAAAALASHAHHEAGA